MWHSKIGNWCLFLESIDKVPGEYSWIEGYDRDGEAEEITGIQCFEELSLYVLWQLKKWGHVFLFGVGAHVTKDIKRSHRDWKSKVAENTDIPHSTVYHFSTLTCCTRERFLHKWKHNENSKLEVSTDYSKVTIPSLLKTWVRLPCSKVDNLPHHSYLIARTFAEPWGSKGPRSPKMENVGIATLI